MQGLIPQGRGCFSGAVVPAESVLQLCHLLSSLGVTLLWSEANHYVDSGATQEGLWCRLRSAAARARLGETCLVLKSDLWLVAAYVGLGGTWERYTMRYPSQLLITTP